MPEWMRSQFMAPAYALLISLAVALALGLSMNKPAEQGNKPQAQTPTTTTNPPPIRVGMKDTGEPKKPSLATPKELVGRSVTIRRVDSSEPLKVGEDGVI